jgi:hypothetical protein
MNSLPIYSVQGGINVFHLIREYGTSKIFHALQKLYNRVEEGSQEEEALYVALEQVNMMRQRDGLSEYHFH